jgi:capsular polysaccharide biosynthesis protein
MAAARSLLAGLPNAPGYYPVGDDAWIEILEAKAEKAHGHIRGIWPPAQAIEAGFGSGPVFVFGVRDAVVDIQAGAVFDRNGDLIRESFGPQSVMDRYMAQTTAPAPEDIRQASGALLPLATLRSNNYCRWWLDSMAKPFLVEQSAYAGPALLPAMATPERVFQEEGLALLDGGQVMAAEVGRFWRADAVNSSGVTYGGGQRIGALSAAFGAAMAADVHATRSASRSFGKRIYVSRAVARKRLVENEKAVIAMLAGHGFEVLTLEKMSLVDQIAAFTEAEVVVAPHGAGLTNLLWTRPGAILLEIFPEGGVHGSAFLRLASQIGIDYFAFVGQATRNRDNTGNPNNADIAIDVAALEAFLADVLG